MVKILIILIVTILFLYVIWIWYLYKKKFRLWVVLSHFYKQELIDRRLITEYKKELTREDLNLEKNVSIETHKDILRIIIRKLPDYANLKDKYLEDIVSRQFNLEQLSHFIVCVPGKRLWKKDSFKN